MKKLICAIICIAILLSSVSITVFASDDLKIIVANDLHLSIKAYTPFKGNTITNPWAHIPSSGQLLTESNAIITAFLENAEKSDADYVILPGDLTDSGTPEEHIIFAAKLAEFEKTSGKQVFVVAGNHDFQKTDIATFESIYADYGYNEAIANDPDTASYVADLTDNYRLLAIDSNDPKTGLPKIDATQIDWIKAQLETAKADGKKVFAMMHHNLLEHFIFGSTIHSSALVKDENLKTILADGGVKFIFTGHTHDQDIASFTSDNGNVIYDVVTNSINAYPCQYREVTFGKDVRFEEKRVTKVNTALIPAGISEEAITLAEADFTEYTKTVMWKGLRKTFTSYINASSLIKLMKLDAEADADMCRIISSLGDKLAEIIVMPFYTEDANGNSLKKVAAKYGKTLPDSKYTDLIDLAITLYQAHCTGDENYSVNSTEVQLLLSAVSTVLCYCLEDVSAEDYTTVLKYVLTLTGTDIPDNLVSFAGSSVKRIEGIDLVATLVLRPLIAEFTTDDAPADNNVTLTGYRELSGFEKFVQLIRDFINKIIDFFRTFFSFIPVSA